VTLDMEPRLLSAPWILKVGPALRQQFLSAAPSLIDRPFDGMGQKTREIEQVEAMVVSPSEQPTHLAVGL
jgi:hypothetical protein